MRLSVVSPAESLTAELLLEYFREREEGFADAGGYRTVLPDPSAFTGPNGVFLRLDGPSGTAIGCGGLRRIEPDAAGARFEVKHLFVRPAGRGSGGGRMLLAELERWAAELGAVTVVLDTNRSLIAAGELYRSRGYVNIAPYNDNPNATDWFAKVLSTPTPTPTSN